MRPARWQMLVWLGLALVTACKPKGPAPGQVAATPEHQGKPLSGESPAEFAERLRWWREARFGMLVHWGLYSQEGCFWNGKDGGTEQMMRRLKIPLADYAMIAGQFNPKGFDASEWARITKNAGMKYLILTAKHHDGFAMWNSPSSDYNIVKRTPWKRDPFKELAEATRKEGLQLGVYYSLGRDWEDPDVPTKDGYRSNTWDFPDEKKKDFTRYFERKVKPQMRELLTQYGPVGVVWFDTAEQISKAQSEELIQLIRSLQPKAVINARAGHGLGDYRVQERYIPEKVNPRPWETCLSLNDHWAFHKTDSNWKSPETLIRQMIDVASKGGNFLLGIGPDNLGVIPAPATERLAGMGRWMAVNGEAIRDTGPCLLPSFPWGRCTSRKTPGGATVYLHVFDWPGEGKLVVPGWTSEVVSASVKATGKKVSVQVAGDGLTLTLPPTPPDRVSSTIVLEVRERLAQN